MKYTLTVEKREEEGTKACQILREQGKMPAVVYGSGKEAEPITVNTKEFEKIWENVGESTLVTLEGLKDDKTVLIQDVSLEPLFETPLHADFYAVRTDQTVNVEVPLVFTGTAPAEKELGGTFIKVMHALSIDALPKDLPSEIEIDISSLITFSDQINVKDVTLPSGVKASVDDSEVIALVQEIQEVEEEVVTDEEVDLSAVEVEKKGKEDEDADSSE